MAEAWGRSKRRGDGFAGLEGHSAYQEALEVISRGSWQPRCLHPLLPLMLRF